MIEARIDNREMEQLFDNIESWAVETKAQIKKELATSARVIEGSAKKSAPVDTGRLRSSLNSTRQNSGFTWKVGTKVHYAPHMEYGTIRIKAKPFLFPAYNEERPIVIENIKKLLSRK